MSQTPFDVARAHRWFAVELNNVAWQFVEAEVRTAADVERMIHAAHAACYHWLVVGDALNHLRAECLIATAYAKAGIAEAAVRHAERTLALKRVVGETLAAFDCATAHGCAANAYALAGRMGDAREEYRRARVAAEGFDDPSEMAVFGKLFPSPFG